MMRWKRLEQMLGAVTVLREAAKSVRFKYAFPLLLVITLARQEKHLTRNYGSLATVAYLDDYPAVLCIL
jgi:hypothetical protein